MKVGCLSSFFIPLLIPSSPTVNHVLIGLFVNMSYCCKTADQLPGRDIQILFVSRSLNLISHSLDLIILTY